MRSKHTGRQLDSSVIGSFFCRRRTTPFLHSSGIFPVVSAPLIVSRRMFKRESGAARQSSGGNSSSPGAFRSLIVAIRRLSSCRSIMPLIVSPAVLGMILPAVNISSLIGRVSYVVVSSCVVVSVLQVRQYWCTVLMLCAMCDRVENCVPLHMLQVVHFARALLPSSDSIADSMLDWVVSGARVLRCVVSYCVMFTTCMWWS